MKFINRKFRLILTTFIFLSFYDVHAQQLNLTLIPSNFNGYNISCFGYSDGSINLTITGGIAPYTIVWSTRDTIEDLENLPAGYYNVRVADSDTIPKVAQAEITLNEPRQLKIDGVVYAYPNGYNISVNGACNGMVNITENGGISPYSWLWSDNNTSQNRTAMCAGWYSVRLVDANGCKAIKDGYLKEPPRGDWLLFGNEGTNPSLNFLGTTDSTDLVIKTNSRERLRVSSAGNFEFNGNLKIDSFSSDTIRQVFVDQNGFMRVYGPISGPPNAPAPDWNTKGNNNINVQTQFIGTLNPADLVFKTTNSLSGPNEAMRINQAGGIGIGTSSIPVGYKMVVDGKVGFREAYVKLSGAWPDYVFEKNYKPTALQEIETFYRHHKHLPGMPSANEISETGQNIGEVQRLQQEKIEEIFIYIVELKKEIDFLKSENKRLKKL